ncbi:MAG: aromatic-ring-hydroxylating dioxygenase subunit beta [Rhodospirillales bacterium]|nr:aromatic-ring-hydroxylating dioxygenase subunit beta [Rhodospirillales bacterium]
MEGDIVWRLARLNAACADAIDSDRLEEWPGFFAEDARYIVTTAENHRAGLAAGLIWADSRAMLEDRVAALRRANIYERQSYRHILGLPLLRAESDGETTAETPFLVVRIMRDGTMSLFAAGRYLDRVRLAPSPLLLERIAVCDNSRFDTLLAIPL